jgi:hypothetical protein
LFIAKFPKPWTFAAWPASFDYPMTELLFHVAGIPMPFDYRTLCIKSFLAGRFGIDVSSSRDSAIESLIVAPEHPHDPYHDALAQARTYKQARNVEIQFTLPGSHD